jgi:WD40 repeat protein
MLTTNILSGHDDEVWNIQWSHSGTFLASASKDKTVRIWRFQVSVVSSFICVSGVNVILYVPLKPGLSEFNCSSEKVLDKHDEPVGCIAWSPDDHVLLTSAENVIKVWNVEVRMFILR